MKRCGNCGDELPGDFPAQPVDNGEVPRDAADEAAPGTFRLEPWCVPCTRAPAGREGIMTP